MHILDGKAALVAGTMSQMDKGGICSQMEAGLVSGGSSAPASLNPAAVRTSGDIMGWDSSKGGIQKRPRKSLRCGFCRKVRENIEETPKSVLQKLSHAHQLPGQAETGWKSTGAGKMQHAARNLAGRFIFCTHILC